MSKKINCHENTSFDRQSCKKSRNQKFAILFLKHPIYKPPMNEHVTVVKKNKNETKLYHFRFNVKLLYTVEITNLHGRINWKCIDGLIFRFENKADALWIQKNDETQAFLTRECLKFN